MDSWIWKNVILNFGVLLGTCALSGCWSLCCGCSVQAFWWKTEAFMRCIIGTVAGLPPLSTNCNASLSFLKNNLLAFKFRSINFAPRAGFFAFPFREYLVEVQFFNVIAWEVRGSQNKTLKLRIFLLLGTFCYKFFEIFFFLLRISGLLIQQRKKRWNVLPTILLLRRWRLVFFNKNFLRISYGNLLISFILRFFPNNISCHNRLVRKLADQILAK